MSDPTTRRADRHVIIEDEALQGGFTQIPNAILRRPDLSTGAKLTYMVLMSFAWQADQCFPGQEALAEAMGVTDRSVRTYVDQLVESGLVRIEKRGQGHTNVYHLRRYDAQGRPLPDARPEKISGQERKLASGPDRKNLPGNKTQRKKTQEKDVSNGPPISGGSEEMTTTVDEGLARSLLADLARELGDEAPLSRSVRRAANLWARAGVERTAFVAAVYAARDKAKAAHVTKTRQGATAGALGSRNRMPYFFAALEDLLGLKAPPD